MEPEGSLPHSQVPANCPYPELAYIYIYICIYICRTAALTSRRYSLNIYSTNILYILNILNMLHNLRFFLFKMPFIS